MEALPSAPESPQGPRVDLTEPASTQPASVAAEGDAPSVPAAVFTWENCTGLVAAMDVPREHVQSQVSGDFDLRGLTAATASLVVEAVACPRAAVSSRVVADAAYLHVSARVKPRDAGARESGVADHYLLFFAASPPDAAPDLKRLGVQALGVQLERETLLNASGTREERWVFQAPEFKLVLAFARTGDAGGGGHARLHLWQAGGGGVLRVDADKAYTSEKPAVQPTTLQHAGDSALQAFLPPVTSWLGQAYLRTHEAWRSNDTVPR